MSLVRFRPRPPLKKQQVSSSAFFSSAVHGMLSIFPEMTAQGHFWIFLMKEKSDGTGEEGGNDEGADLADGDPGIRCNGYAASRLNAICSTHGISEDLLYDHFSGKTIFTWPDSHCFLDVTEYLKEKDIGMPGSCCLRRSGHCGRRLTPLIEGYIGAVLALFVSKLVSKLKLPSILGWLIASMILGPHALSLVSQEPHGIKASCMSWSVPWA